MLVTPPSFLVILSCYILCISGGNIFGRNEEGQDWHEDDSKEEFDEKEPSTLADEELKEIAMVLKSYFSRKVEVHDGPPINFIPSKRVLIEERELEDDIDEEEDDRKNYLNQWVVYLRGGQEIARRVIEGLDYNFHGRIKGFKDVYEVSHKYEYNIRKRRETVEITSHLNEHESVTWAEQQYILRREKRFLPRELEESEKMLREHQEKNADRTRKVHQIEGMFNDEDWPKEWYIIDTRTNEDLPELDLDIIRAWEAGYTGKGVKVTIIDDGLEHSHPDLVDSYDPSISYDINDDDDDPTPRYDEKLYNSHGTSCAGEIVMKPNNSLCGVGVAYGAKIGGIRLLDGIVTDKNEAGSIGLISDKVDIVSCSWGPNDNGKTVDGPGRLLKWAMEDAIQKGRGGKGTIFVWASGNGGSYGDNCNCDGYASSIYTVGIGSASESGHSPFYAELCSSNLATTYSSGAYVDQKISTTTLKGKCTSSFTGTSAAAPLAAGMIALAIEANPHMTWRDVQHALIQTSSYERLRKNPGWKVNAKGLHYNPRFGFGLLQGFALAKTSKNWNLVPEKTIAEVYSNTDYESYATIIASGNAVNIEFEYSEGVIRSLEHVQVITTIDHPIRGSLSIYLTSPQGTKTKILGQRRKDKSSKGFERWPLMSLETWGEDPRGIWKLRITSESFDKYGQLREAILVLHGTQEIPEHLKENRKL